MTTVRPSAAQCPDGSPSPCRSTSHVPVSPPANSLAVLYFDNLSSDSAFAYLADGLTEELIAKLGDVPRLRVRSSFSVRRYRGTPTADPAAVGGALGVTFLVTGSVRPGRDRLRIAVELVRAGTGARVWGRVFDRPSADPLGVTAEIARAIAAEVAGTLLPAERAVLARRPTPHPQAYDHLLRGNYYLAQRSARAGVRAIEEYQEAVQGDPTFGTAFGRLALAYEFARKYIWDVGLPPDTLEARARYAARRARQLDSLNTDALLALSLLGGEFERAAWDRAVARDSDNAELQHLYGIGLAIWGWLSILAVADGRFGEALRWADSALTLNPTYPGYAHRAAIDLQLGHTMNARADATASMNVSGGSGIGAASMALVEVATADTARGRSRLQQLLGADLHGPLPTDEARAYAVAALGLLGDTAAALDLLERPPADRFVGLLASLSVFDPLRSHVRFQRVVEWARPQ